MKGSGDTEAIRELGEDSAAKNEYGADAEEGLDSGAHEMGSGNASDAAEEGNGTSADEVPAGGVELASEEQGGDNHFDKEGGSNEHRAPKEKLVLGAAIAAAVAIIGIIAFNLLMASVPDVSGFAPKDALEEIRAASDAWEISFITDEGEEVASPASSDYNGYEVKQTDPAAGEPISRNDEAASIVVTIGKSEETIRAERQAVIDAEIQNSLANGWQREEYDDQGSYVEFRGFSTDGAFSEELGGGYWHPDGPQSENALLYRSMAAELESTVITACYTQDGYLAELYVAPFEGASEDELEVVASRVRKIIREANEENYRRAEEFIASYCSAQQEAERASGSSVTLDYSFEHDAVYISAMYDGNSLTWGGTKHEQEEQARGWRTLVQWLAWVTDRSVTYTDYEGDGDVFFTAEASPGDYEVLTIVEPQ